jgi:hypothetical protein
MKTPHLALFPQTQGILSSMGKDTAGEGIFLHWFNQQN